MRGISNFLSIDPAMALRAPRKTDAKSVAGSPFNGVPHLEKISATTSERTRGSPAQGYSVMSQYPNTRCFNALMIGMEMADRFAHSSAPPPRRYNQIYSSSSFSERKVVAGLTLRIARARPADSPFPPSPSPAMSNLFLARCQRSRNGRRNGVLPLFGGGGERQS